jgi:hypothetical protein
VETGRELPPEWDTPDLVRAAAGEEAPATPSSVLAQERLQQLVAIACMGVMIYCELADSD